MPDAMLWPRRVLIGVVHGYRFALSPWLGSACRFEPTCSAYALQALETHGASAGAYLTLRRFGRCHPACDGGFDPVPARMPTWWPSALSSSCQQTAAPSTSQDFSAKP